MPYGLLSTGFVPQPTTDIRDEINNAVQQQFGASIDVSDSSLLGFLIGIVSERLGLLWELSESVYASQDPDKASGAALDALCALTGTFRTGAAPSKVTLTLTGTPATVVSAGSRASTVSTSAQFETTANATITLLPSWITAHTYAIGDRVKNASRCYVALTAGAAGVTAPTTTGANINDGGVHWRYMGEGTGAADVAAQCTVTGPTVAVSGDIARITTPISGWSSVLNLLDASEGSDLGSDESTRLRRGVDLDATGTGTPNAIREALLEVKGVTAVTVFYNDTDTTDADGIPPHRVECLVRGDTSPIPSDTAQAIWNKLLDNVPAGVGTATTVTTPSSQHVGTAVDTAGNSHTMRFSEPDPRNIYVIVNAIIDSSEFPSDGVQQIKDAIVAYGDAQPTGKDAVASAVSASAFRVDGVLDISSVYIGTAPSPASAATIACSSRQLAVFDTSRIDVNTTPGTP